MAYIPVGVSGNKKGISSWIGASADAKPTGLVPGSKVYEYDTKAWYITYDGDNWEVYQGAGGGLLTASPDIGDDVLFEIGTDKDGVILNRSTVLNADTALTGVLIGTPDVGAIAANSLIIANTTADGDILIAGNDGGHSRAALFFDSSSAITYIGKPGAPISFFTSGDVWSGGAIGCSGGFNVEDDTFVSFGNSNDAQIRYYVADTDARIMRFSLDESDDSGNNVPVFLFSEGAGGGGDLGLFDAFVQPLVAILDNDADSWFGITFSADDTPQLQCGGAATAIAVNAPITLSDVAAPFTIGGANAFAPVVVRKTADQAVNNSTTIVNDTHLLFAIAANEVWDVQITLITETATVAPHFKSAIAFPAGAKLYGRLNHRQAGGTETTEDVLDSEEIPSYCYDYAACEVIYHFIVVNSSTAGNVQLQWAQNGAVVEDTKVLTNSCLIAHRLA